MGNNVKDLVGQKFGRLTVIEDSGERYYQVIKWRCKCECGNECLAMGYQLKNGSIKSCGCYNRDRVAKMGKRNSTDKLKIFREKLDKNNTSGARGVTWNKQCNKWIARICVDKVLYHLCISKDKEVCIEARKNAEKAILENRFDEFIKQLKAKDTTQSKDGK
jgi:hypothetical protein